MSSPCLSGNAFLTAATSVMYRCGFVPSNKSIPELKALIQVTIQKHVSLPSQRHPPEGRGALQHYNIKVLSEMMRQGLVRLAMNEFSFL